jgi:Putative esterase
VITPEGRGPDGWYYGHTGADTFEVWADVARRYHLDPNWTVVTGYSMGGYGTYKFATQFPDLFARAQPTVGPPGVGIWIPPGDPEPGGAGSNTNRMLASVRHVPFLIWNSTDDELVPVEGPVAQAQTFDDLGLRYIFDLFAPPSDHFALAVNDQFKPAADFLGTHRVHRTPNHVTYVVNPSMDFKNVGTVADHAYWLSGLRLRDTGGSSLGHVDALSHAFGHGDPPPQATQHSAGALTGGSFPAMPYAEQSKAWGKAPAMHHADTLTLDLQNLKRVRVATARAGLSCHPKLDVSTDGPATVVLAGCGRSLHFG